MSLNLSLQKSDPPRTVRGTKQFVHKSLNTVALFIDLRAME